MCKYCGTDKYRKIYENHYGPIPVEDNGRSYHIHHVDGNHNNNCPDNLVALTNQQHYDVHYARGDYAACLRLAAQLKVNPLQVSALASQANKYRVEAGTHNFLDSDAAQVRARKLVAEGRCNLVGDSNPVHKLVADGTHHFQDSEFSRSRALKRSAKGTHNFQGKSLSDKQKAEGTHPTQIKKICPYCNASMNAPLYGRYHGAKCKAAPVLSSL